jgi:hypothetical protein
MRRHLRRNAVAYLALFVALGGTSYAALRLPAGSVGNRQIRNQAVSAAKIAPGAITRRSTQASSTSAVTTTSTNSPAKGTVVPLRGSKWHQGRGEDDLFFGNLAVAGSCFVGTGAFKFPGIAFVQLYAGTQQAAGGAASSGPGSVSGPVLFGPAHAASRQLTARAYDNCTDGGHFTVTSVKVDVLAVR